ncbi:MAG: hypothetical protein KC550_04680 [Nanoarchaeota archaeon]|nr:hypothetical protein [Nanoarchaeota archaeon]
MAKKKSLIEKIDEEFLWDRKTVGYFFLGVGLTMFIINITLILSVMKIWSSGYPMSGYYISIISSIILMTYSLYNIYVED